MDSSPKLWPKIKNDHEKNTHGNGNAKFKSRLILEEIPWISIW